MELAIGSYQLEGTNIICRFNGKAVEVRVRVGVSPSGEQAWQWIASALSAEDLLILPMTYLGKGE